MQFIYLTLFYLESEPETSIDFILITCICHTIPFLIKHVLRLKIFRMNNETIIGFGFGSVFSLTWPASMLIYWNKRKFLHKKRVQFPQDCLGTTTRSL